VTLLYQGFCGIAPRPDVCVLWGEVKLRLSSPIRFGLTLVATSALALCVAESASSCNTNTGTPGFGGGGGSGSSSGVVSGGGGGGGGSNLVPSGGTSSSGVWPGNGQVTLTPILCPVPAAFTSADHVAFTVGSAGTFTATTSGIPDGASIVISQTGSLPSGVIFINLNNGTAILFGTPAAKTAGTYPITLTANNGIGSPITQDLTLTVNNLPTYKFFLPLILR